MTNSLTAKASAGRILFVQHCANFTGSTISGRLTAEGLVDAGWQVDVAFGFEGPACAWYRDVGCRTLTAPHRNWLRGGNFFQSSRRMATEVVGARRFRRIMREVRPDLVYVNSLVSLAAAVAARSLSIPVVWHIRELFDDVGGEMRVPACGGKGLVRRTLNRLADQLVAISSAVAENVIGESANGKLAASKTTIVPNAVGPEYFEEQSKLECRKALGLPAEATIVGVPGTLRPMKGHPFFLEAAAILHEAMPDCLFAITGDGEPGYRSELLAQAERAGLTGSVRWLGTVKDMRKFYAACDAVCIPSRAEPFGRTVIEAFACGAPVVASAVGGIRETVEDGENGLLVEYGDANALAKSIESLLANPQRMMEMSRAAAQCARGKYIAKTYQARIATIVASSLRRAGASDDRAAGGIATASLN